MAQAASATLFTTPAGSRWVGMRGACEILGVNQSTLREWTDRGRVPVFLTPGRHRRYREADLLALARPSGGASTSTPLAAALLGSRERYGALAERVLPSSSWSHQFDEAARGRFRSLGNALLSMLNAYVEADTNSERETCLSQAGTLAAQYGEGAAAAGLSAAEATEAFVVFRKPILNLVHDWLADQPNGMARVSGTLDRVDHFLDHILVHLVSAHEGASGAPATSGHRESPA